jgi:hypothetical protein
LATFAVTRGGRIVAALRDRPSPQNPIETEGGALVIYSPERELLREIPLPIGPTALSLDGQDGFLVAGNGKLLHLAEDGSLLRETAIFDLLGITRAELEATALKAAQQFSSEIQKRSREQITELEKTIEKMEAIATPTERQKARIASTKQMLESQQAQLKETPSAENMLAHFVNSRTRATAVSCDGSSILLTLQEFRHYEVLRLNRDFTQPRRILGDLQGCCDQMDVVLSKGRIFTAENTRFKVGTYDLDGKKLGEFGERFKAGNQGFGSCCNPMNVLPLESGDLLTAESSIGTLKRFSPEGQLLGVIGRARIGDGCKHVAVGFDAQRDRYYVQYQDRNHICVLLPKAEAAPIVAEQDRQIAQGEERMQEFEGSWSIHPCSEALSPEAFQAKLAGRLPFDFGEFEAAKINLLQSLHIEKGHRVGMERRPRAEGEGSPKRQHLRWVVTGLEGEAVHVELEEADGRVSYNLTLRPLPDTSLELRSVTLKGEKFVWKLTRP